MIYAREFEAQWSAPTSGMFDHDLLRAALLPDNFVFDQSSKAATMPTGVNPATWREMARNVTGSPAESPAATAARSSAAVINTGPRYANAVLP
jgi:hypothetical protein